MPENMEKGANVRTGVAGIADRLVRAEMGVGVKRAEAERAVSRRLGLAASSLEYLRRGKIKNVEAIGAKLRAGLIAEYERQLARLENELAVARLLNRQIDFDAVQIAIGMAQEELHGKAD